MKLNKKTEGLSDRIKKLLNPVTAGVVYAGIFASYIGVNTIGYQPINYENQRYWVNQGSDETIIRTGNLATQEYWIDQNNDGTIDRLKWTVSSSRGGAGGTVTFENNELNEIRGHHFGEHYVEKYAHMNSVLKQVNE